MKNKSLAEEILEAAFKSPITGVVLSIFFAGLGFYLTNKQAPVDAKPTEALVLPMMHMLGKISYFASVIVLIVTGIGYVVTSLKKKKQSAFFGTRRSLEYIKNILFSRFVKVRSFRPSHNSRSCCFRPGESAGADEPDISPRFMNNYPAHMII